MTLRLTAVPYLALEIVFCATSLLAQEKPLNAPVPGAIEFPVIMQQSVVAGKTPVGAQVRAKLQAATLVNGTVFPRNTTLIGEVLDSQPKTATNSSRLAIRMDSAQWKNGSAPVTVYLTVWYYLLMSEAGQNLQYGPPQPPNRTWNGQGAYPNPNSPSYKPFPGSDADTDHNSVPDTATTRTSDRRAVMKDIDVVRADDGSLTLTSGRANIKLDKLTTYVFASADLSSKK
jgi:hypothetical protein